MLRWVGGVLCSLLVQQAAALDARQVQDLLVSRGYLIQSWEEYRAGQYTIARIYRRDTPGRHDTLKADFPVTFIRACLKATDTDGCVPFNDAFIGVADTAEQARELAMDRCNETRTGQAYAVPEGMRTHHSFKQCLDNVFFSLELENPQEFERWKAFFAQNTPKQQLEGK